MENKKQDNSNVIFKDVAKLVKEPGTAKDDVFKFVITSENIDRDIEIINVNGLNYDNFLNNPVCFYNHNGYSLPIGTWKNLEKVNNGKQITAELTLLPDDIGTDNNALASSVKKLLKAGVLNACSIGFIPLDTKKLTISNEETALSLPTGNTIEITPELRSKILSRYNSGVVYHHKSELLEISVVTIPANAESIAVKMFKDDDLTAKEFKAVFDKDIEKIKPAEIEKAGKVLSKTNAGNLKKAVDLITGVLVSAGVTADDDTDDETDDKANTEIINKVQEIVKEYTKEITESFETKLERINELLSDSIELQKQQLLVNVKDETPEPPAPAEPKKETKKLSLDELRNL